MKSISLLELKILLHKHIERHGSLHKAARALGVNVSWLCQAMKPGAVPIPSIVAAIGYREAEQRYERAK